MLENIKLIEENWLIVFMAFLGLWGCVSYTLCGIGYDILKKHAIAMEDTKNPFVKQMRLRYENGEKLGIRKQSAYCFVTKYLDRYMFMGWPIRNYMKMAWLCALFCMMCGLIGGILEKNSWYVAYASVCAISVVCVGKIEDINYKEKIVVNTFVEYFDKFLTFDKKVVESEVKEDYNTIGKVNESPQKEESFSEELIEEVLREFLT